MLRRLSAVLVCFVLGCGGGGHASLGVPRAASFQHFTFAITPTVPVKGRDFELSITAYSSTDDSVPMTGYDGTLSLTASQGNLSGQVSAQPITGGQATLVIQIDTAGTGITLTATDDDNASITGKTLPLTVILPGDTAAVRDVVINEINWFGNDNSSADEWIELRNVSGGELNLSGWTLTNAGTFGSPTIEIDDGTSLADGDYLIIAKLQGTDVDGSRTSLTGVEGVQLHRIELSNSGEALELHDAAGTLIDQTPTGAWAAGDATNDLSMERRDNFTGGGYTDGAAPSAWYTWSSLDGRDTTHPDSSDRGTPGAANTNPNIFDHFTLSIQPSSPRANIDFTLTITAYSSAGDTTVITNYNGTVSVAASSGTLTGQVAKQPITGGTATLTLRDNTVASGVVLSVTDDIYPHITGSTAGFDIQPEGDPASLRQVVINEVNWFGNNGSTSDEWFEIRNVSGGPLSLAGWTIENAGTGANPITIPSGTVLADSGYLVLGRRQGPDVAGQQTSLTGVAGVVVVSLSLANGGEHLVLRDVNGTLIDETPNPGWPAGNSAVQYSMERRDDITDLGYTDGALDGAWYTWSSLDGSDTTNPNSSDRGTPGAANTNPNIFDHFTVVVAPTTPVVATDFTVQITAYSSTDDSVQITGYNGTLSVTEQVTGSLSGQLTSQTITGGMATLTLQFDTPTPSLALTVTDDIYPGITVTTAPFAILDTGDNANLRDVVINEVNWFGNDASSSDEWIELRNVSGATLDLSGWTIDGAGSGAGAVTIASGTTLAAGGYLLIADRQGPDVDGSRTSLTGVSNVQIATGIALSNTSDPLTLRDIDGTLIDQTPAGTWPAGDSGLQYSMERRDDITGGGYTDGSVAGAWYTWNVYGSVDTTHPDSSDSGTPGAANSDPNAFRPPVSMPYATSFEAGEPEFENLSTGGYSTTPPPGTTANTGSNVATMDSITTSYTARQLQSKDCITLVDDTTTLVASVMATASNNNGGNALTARIKILWFTDAACATPHSTPTSVGAGVGLSQGSYSSVSFTGAPPLGATHFKVRFEIHDNNGLPNDGDAFAADDFAASQG